MKIHLQRVDEPLEAGKDIEAMCGVVVARAIFPMIVDTEYEEIVMIRSISFCPKCYAIKGSGKYVYALAPGQEAKTEVSTTEEM